MKKFMTYILIISLSLIFTAPNVFAERVMSLRTADIDDLPEMFSNQRSMAVDGGIEVNYEDQPPLIPHGIDKTRITLHENSCLGCHSKENQKITNAVEPPKSHYKTREGDRLRKISTGRYFCTQCHVPQAYKKELIGNNFKK